ncbi:MAG: exosome complex protein Rrp42 [Acidilobaceae archaeon]
MSVTPFRVPIVPSLKIKSYLSFYEKGLRPDGRSLVSPRPVEIQTGVIDKAEGSALVKLGNTEVLAGIKAEVGSPFRDTPDEGAIVVNVETVPLASPVSEPGPPDENAIEVARVVDRSLREPRVVDLKSLSIRAGEKAWVLWIDIYVLNHDGNLFDACTLASVAALATTKLPLIEESETGDIIVDRTRRGEKININKLVVSVTIAKVGDYLIVDPNFEEEVISDYRLIISLDRDFNIVGLQKTGSGGFTIEEFKNAIKLARRASEEYFKVLEKVLKEGA